MSKLNITEESIRLHTKLIHSDTPCETSPPELFSPNSRRLLEAAKKICGECPIKSTCLQVGQMEKHSGVWGGEYLEVGKILERPFRNKRPLKKAA